MHKLLNETNWFSCRCIRETPLCDNRVVWDLLIEEQSRNAVVIAEKYVNGNATDGELGISCNFAYNVASNSADHAAMDAAWAAAWASAWGDTADDARAVANATVRAVAKATIAMGAVVHDDSLDSVIATQTKIFMEVFE